MGRILIIDDYEPFRDGLGLYLRQKGHQSVATGSGRAGLERMKDQSFDLVITDYRMEEMDGLAVVEAVKREAPETDVMMMTAHGEDTHFSIGVEAMKRGAIDFIEKSFSHDQLWLKIEKALNDQAVRRDRERLGEENRYLREEIESRFGKIVGESPPMLAVLAQVSKVASSESSVLIYGESGTGKELVARAIHYQSKRREGSFVKVNCGALPDGLVESELFGHERGAFTNAVRRHKGKFELAEGGTIFLDEIGDVPLDTQVRLLRVLQEKQFNRVGGEQTLDADVRVVAATNRPLKQMVEEGTFRRDLFYRLEVIPLSLPPLCERGKDIELLAKHFIRKKCGEMNIPLKRLTSEALTGLGRYPWPGNVRELENVIERTIVLADGDEIGYHDLPLTFDEEMADAEVPNAEAIDDGELLLNERLDAVERDLIARAMEEAHHVKTKAAALLGIKTSALYYKLDKYGLD